MFDWGDGKIGHFVPKDWRFPERLSVKAMWDLWFCGNQDIGIRPYRLINHSIDLVQEDKMKVTRVRKVVGFMEKIITELESMPRGTTSISNISMVDNDRTFDEAFVIMIQRVYNGKKVDRVEGKSYGTLYNKIVKLGKV